MTLKKKKINRMKLSNQNQKDKDDVDIHVDNINIEIEPSVQDTVITVDPEEDHDKRKLILAQGTDATCGKNSGE